MRALAVGAVLVAILAGFVAFLSPATRGAKSATCGVERWNVKTLQDAAASEVDFANPNTKFVEFLRRLNEKGNPSSGKPPKNLTKTTPRMPPVETTVYKLKALLMSMRREDDKDIHLVIADPKIGGSMIVEFPHESCTTEPIPRAAQRCRRQSRPSPPPATAYPTSGAKRSSPSRGRRQSPASASSIWFMARAASPQTASSSILS
jgi:hypothetical protein